MKKTLALLLTVIFIIGSLAACGTQPTSTPTDNDNSTPSQTQSDVVDTNSNKDETPATNETPDKEEDQNENNTPSNTNKEDQKPAEIDKNNFFLNNNNNFYDQNAISVRPKHVYWENGKLVAKCFVVNGFNHPVFNINVKKLSFSNEDGLIAEGVFGKLNGVTLQPYTHIEWTFTFSADCIAKYGADITSLIYNSSVENNF